jgi:hypothetical protein
MFIADKNKVNAIHLLHKLYYIQHFQIQCLKLFKCPKRNGHLNAQQQWAFKRAPAAGI